MNKRKKGEGGKVTPCSCSSTSPPLSLTPALSFSLSFYPALSLISANLVEQVERLVFALSCFLRLIVGQECLCCCNMGLTLSQRSMEHLKYVVHHPAAPTSSSSSSASTFPPSFPKKTNLMQNKRWGESLAN